MLAGPLLGGALLDFFTFRIVFMFGAIVLIAGTAIFWRNN